jgi:hypothetical protein
MTTHRTHAARRALATAESANSQPEGAYAEYQPWGEAFASQIPEDDAPKSAQTVSLSALRSIDPLGMGPEPVKPGLGEAEYVPYSRGGPWTPWGSAQSARTIQRGVQFYSTAGHGGMGITEAVAEKHLTDAARIAAGRPQQGKYWFEEDIDFAIPLYEQPEWARAYFGKRFGVQYPSLVQGVLTGPSYARYREDRVTGAKESKPKPAPVLTGDSILLSQEPLELRSGRTIPAGTKLRVHDIGRTNLTLHIPGIGLLRIAKAELAGDSPRFVLSE